MKFEFTEVVGDVDMSWEIPQPATGDFAGLPVDGEPILDKCWIGAVLTVGERPQNFVDPDDPEDGDEDNPMMPAGLYVMIADGLGFNSGREFYRPCATVSEAQGYLDELTLDKFEANAEPYANPAWILALGWTDVPL